jgi:hypothetical protein
MVNYRYEPEKIPERADHYATAGEVASSNAVKELLAE